MKHPDLTGRLFGRLIVRFPGTSRNKYFRRWWCDCSCGGESLVVEYKLLSGHTKSCGCLAREKAAGTNRALRCAQVLRRFEQGRALFLQQGLPVPDEFVPTSRPPRRG